MWKVEQATPEDFEWIKPLFKKNKKILGSVEMAIYRFKKRKEEKPDDTRDQFIVVRPYGFAHFLQKKNGERTLYEIAVDDSMKRKGIGKALMDKIGYPMSLKTDADNKESNEFYKRLGFVWLGAKYTKSGKLVNVYVRGSWVSNK